MQYVLSISFTTCLAIMELAREDGHRGVYMCHGSVSRIFRRSFHYASIRYASLDCSITRASAPTIAACSPLNSVVNHGFSVNSAGHEPESTPIRDWGIGKRARRAARSDASGRARTDTYPARQSRSRLVQLARLLGRQMARQNFAAQTNKRFGRLLKTGDPN